MGSNKYDEISKEIEEKIAYLKNTDKMTSIEALKSANEIIKLINTLIEIGGNYVDLYNKAANIYIIAANKVPSQDKDIVEFPSNYWGMRAKEESLKINRADFNLDRVHADELSFNIDRAKVLRSKDKFTVGIINLTPIQLAFNLDRNKYLIYKEEQLEREEIIDKKEKLTNTLECIKVPVQFSPNLLDKTEDQCGNILKSNILKKEYIRQSDNLYENNLYENYLSNLSEYGSNTYVPEFRSDIYKINQLANR